MNNTDWESKFISIVRDTESNIERVKNKLGSAKPLTTDVGALLTNQSGDDAAWSHSNRYDTQVFPLEEPHFPDGLSYVPIDKSPSLVMLLSEKIDAQAQAIDQLMKNNQNNWEERTCNSKQVQDLRDEVTRLKSRMAERGVDLVTEQKLARLQQESSYEMKNLQSQIQSLRSCNDELLAKNGALASAVSELQRFVNTEVDYLRRDVNAMKSKTESLSVDVANLVSQRREVEQHEERHKDQPHKIMHKNSRHARTDRAPPVIDTRPSVTLLSPAYESSDSLPNFGRLPTGRRNIESLRSEYKALQKKLNILESNLNKKGQSSRGKSLFSESRYTSESALTATEPDSSLHSYFTDLLALNTTSCDDLDAMPSESSSDDEFTLPLDNL